MDVTRLRAEPGGQAQLSVKVKNPGHLVESFHMDVVGLDPSWWQVHPPELTIYPGKEESAVVLLKPPANAQAPDEALPFGVRAVSTLDAQRTVVEEGDLEIGRVLDLQASITPVTSRGRWSGRHTITYQNWGNSPVHLRLSVSDKDEALGFRLEPEQVSVPVGSSATARLRVRPRNPFMRGAAGAPDVPGRRRVDGRRAAARHPALGDGPRRRARSRPSRARRRDPAPADPVQGRGRARRAVGGRDRGARLRGDEDERRRRCPDAGRGAASRRPSSSPRASRRSSSSCAGRPATAPSSTASSGSTRRATPCWAATT